jgi:membrane protease YdiL (CAAX protease family)
VPSFNVWPLPVLLGIGLCWLLEQSQQAHHPAFGWYKWGKLCKEVLVAGVAFVTLSSLALVFWFIWMQPDVSDLKNSIPDLPLGALLAGGLFFSVTNAFAEEFLFRGLVFSNLETLQLRRGSIVLLQAISFGCIHFNGFPRGFIGVGLASVYGVMMGCLRLWSGGLAAPWLFHIFADVTIVIILLGWVG